MSPPARGRGLKRCRSGSTVRCRRVAPRAGAWIETRSVALSDQPMAVAPRAGAWIETSILAIDVRQMSGRPPRGGVD